MGIKLHCTINGFLEFYHIKSAELTAIGAYVHLHQLDTQCVKFAEL